MPPETLQTQQAPEESFAIRVMNPFRLLGSGVDLAKAARIVRTMRLRENEAAAIREEVARLDPAARVWLFGSRVDDGARCGDIDLLVRSDRIGFADKVLLKVRVLGRIGAQQLDLVVAPASPACRGVDRERRPRGPRVMTPPDARVWLRAALDDLAQAREHLAFSSARVAGIDFARRAPTPEELERIEAYTSRFVRVVDLLVNKALRALDRYELADEGTLLDVLHRAEKRGLIGDAEAFRAMKEVRNIIAHD